MRIVAFVIIGLIALAFITGCGSTGALANSRTALYQAIGTDRAAVTTTATLVRTGTIKPADAQNVYTGAVSAEAGLHLWDAAVNSGDPAQAAASKTAVTQSLTNLLGQLQAISNVPAVKARRRASRYTVPAPAVKLSPAEVITIVQLAVELTPQIETWVNQIMSTNAATEAQVTQGFADLDAALVDLRSAINGVQPLGPASPVVTPPPATQASARPIPPGFN